MLIGILIGGAIVISLLGIVHGIRRGRTYLMEIMSAATYR